MVLQLFSLSFPTTHTRYGKAAFTDGKFWIDWLWKFENLDKQVKNADFVRRMIDGVFFSDPVLCIEIFLEINHEIVE
jgi:hypothetical protein